MCRLMDGWFGEDISPTRFQCHRRHMKSDSMPQEAYIIWFSMALRPQRCGNQPLRHVSQITLKLPNNYCSVMVVVTVVSCLQCYSHTMRLGCTLFTHHEAGAAHSGSMICVQVDRWLVLGKISVPLDFNATGGICNHVHCHRRHI